MDAEENAERTVLESAGIVDDHHVLAHDQHQLLGLKNLWRWDRTQVLETE